MDSLYFLGDMMGGKREEIFPISHIRKSCQSSLKGNEMAYNSLLTDDYFRVNIMSSVAEHLEK